MGSVEFEVKRPKEETERSFGEFARAYSNDSTGTDRVATVSMTGEEAFEPKEPTKFEYAREDSNEAARYQGGGAVDVDATGESEVRRKAASVDKTASRAYRARTLVLCEPRKGNSLNSQRATSHCSRRS